MKPEPEIAEQARRRYLGSEHFREARQIRAMISRLGYDPDNLKPEERMRAVQEWEQRSGTTYDPNFLAMMASDGASGGMYSNKNLQGKTMSSASEQKKARKRNKVKKVMEEWRSGKLRGGSGDKVTNQRQAVAIAMHEASIARKKDMGGAAMPAMSSVDATLGGSFVPPPSAPGAEKPFHWSAKPFHRRKIKQKTGVKSFAQKSIADSLEIARVLPLWHEPVLRKARGKLIQLQSQVFGGDNTPINATQERLMKSGDKPLTAAASRPRWNEATLRQLDGDLLRNPSSLAPVQHLLKPLLRHDESLTESNKSFAAKTKKWNDQARVPKGSRGGGQWTSTTASGHGGGALTIGRSENASEPKPAPKHQPGALTIGRSENAPEVKPAPKHTPGALTIGRSEPVQGARIRDRFDSAKDPMNVGSKVKARKVLHIGGGSDRHGNYVPIREFASSQDDLEVIGHRTGVNPWAEVQVRNSRGETAWVRRDDLRGKTKGGKRQVTPAAMAPEHAGEVEHHFGTRNQPLIHAMRKQGKFYPIFHKDFAPAFAQDLPIVGTPQFNDEEMSITFPFAASHGRDRVGDFLDVRGIDTTNHRRNPVAFIDHGKIPDMTLPIGKCEDPHGNYTVRIYPEQGLAVATVFLDRNPKNKVAQQIYNLFKQKILRAGSIGYRPLNKPQRLAADPDSGTPAGNLLDRVELLEVTLTGLPANGDAVRATLERGWQGKRYEPEIVEMLEGIAA